MPLPLAAQQSDEPDREGRRVLRDLVSLRGEYAREVECFLSGCGCGRDDLRCQVQLDKVLYDVDRAIDLYAQGSGIPPAWGPEEQRAGAYALIVDNLAHERGCITPVVVLDVLVEMARSSLDLVDATAQLEAAVGAANPAALAMSALLRHVISAAEAGATSPTVTEGILRGLVDVPPGIIINDPPAVDDRLSVVVVAARAVPLRVEEGIRVLIDLIELIVGATTNTPGAATALTSTGAIAVTVLGVGRSPNVGAGVAGFDHVGPILSALSPQSGNLGFSLNALSQARVALRAAMRAIADPTNIAANRQAALTAAGNVHDVDSAGRAGAQPTAASHRRGRRAPGAEQRGRGLHRRTCDCGARGAPAGPAADRADRPRADSDRPGGGAAHRLAGDPGERHAVISRVFDEQLRSEQDWQTLVRSLAPRCLGPGQAELALAGLDLLRGSPRHLAVINVQRESFPDERVSLARIAANVDRLNGLVNDTVYRVTNFGRKVNRFTRQTGADEILQEAFDAARDVTEEAVQFAHDEDLIAMKRQKAIDWLHDQRKAQPKPPGGSSGAPQTGPYVPAGPTAQTAGTHAPTQSTPGTLPAVSDIAQRIYPHCRTRGEVRAAVDAQPELRADWQDVNDVPESGGQARSGVRQCVDDLLDASKKTRIDTSHVDDVLQRAAYPVRLSR